VVKAHNPHTNAVSLKKPYKCSRSVSQRNWFIGPEVGYPTVYRVARVRFSHEPHKIHLRLWQPTGLQHQWTGFDSLGVCNKMSGSSRGRTSGFQSANRSSILLLDTVKSEISVGDGISGFQPEGVGLTPTFRSKKCF
jgi:hypothetical protein